MLPSLNLITMETAVTVRKTLSTKTSPSFAPFAALREAPLKKGRPKTTLSLYTVNNYLE